MQIHRLDEQTIALEEIDPFCRHLLLSIPYHADPSGSEAAEARLFSSPTHGAEPEADADWKEYVEPDLRQLFQSAVETVQGDLANLPTDNEAAATLRLPLAHLEPWIHTLNQARLALTARHGLSDGELERNITLDEDVRSQALFEVRFYGLLQEFFLHQLEVE